MQVKSTEELGSFFSLFVLNLSKSTEQPVQCYSIGRSASSNAYYSSSFYPLPHLKLPPPTTAYATRPFGKWTVVNGANKFLNDASAFIILRLSHVSSLGPLLLSSSSLHGHRGQRGKYVQMVSTSTWAFSWPTSSLVYIITCYGTIIRAYFSFPSPACE